MLTLHDLVDDQLGQLLTGEPFSLAPGDLYDTVTGGFEFSATITQTTVNSATWTAFNNSQETASASASALVDVSSTPTSVSLTGFGDGGPASTPFLFGALALFVVGLGFAMRRKFTA
jgi:MYXO-CTERM domain-containing protein